MLSRRDKLYVQPWEERRFQDHRSKVRTALPAVDARAPPPRAHVAVKLKKYQREAERVRKIQDDNYSLLQRLAAIMRSKRLDNWLEPQYNRVAVKLEKWLDDNYSLLQRLAAIMRSKRLDSWLEPQYNVRDKVGVFYSAPALRARASARAARADARSCAGAAHVKCYACYTNRKSALQLNKGYASSQTTSLPSI